MQRHAIAEMLLWSTAKLIASDVASEAIGCHAGRRTGSASHATGVAGPRSVYRFLAGPTCTRYPLSARTRQQRIRGSP